MHVTLTRHWLMLLLFAVQLCVAALAVFSCRWFKDHLLLVSTYQTGACGSFHEPQL